MIKTKLKEFPIVSPLFQLIIPVRLKHSIHSESNCMLIGSIILGTRPRTNSSSRTKIGWYVFSLERLDSFIEDTNLNVRKNFVDSEKFIGLVCDSLLKLFTNSENFSVGNREMNHLFDIEIRNVILNQPKFVWEIEKCSLRYHGYEPLSQLTCIKHLAIFYLQKIYQI